MFPWGRRAKDERARIDADVGALMEVEADPYGVVRSREHAAVDESEARHWSRVAVEIAKRTGPQVGLDAATRMAERPGAVEGAPGGLEAEPSESLTLIVRSNQGGCMPLVYRLQFLVPSADGLRVVSEHEVRAPNAGTAIEEMGRAVWPARATVARLVNLDGKVILETSRPRE